MIGVGFWIVCCRILGNAVEASAKLGVAIAMLSYSNGLILGYISSYQRPPLTTPQNAMTQMAACIIG
jgi:hypothetical protein